MGRLVLQKITLIFVVEFIFTPDGDEASTST